MQSTHGLRATDTSGLVKPIVVRFLKQNMEIEYLNNYSAMIASMRLIISSTLGLEK